MPFSAVSAFLTSGPIPSFDTPPSTEDGRNRTPLFLLDIEMDSGTERVSDRQVNAPSTSYEPFIVSWGVFENSIPIPVGMPIVGDAKFKLAESESRKWRDLFAHQTPRRRKVKLWALFEGESLQYRVFPTELRTPFFTGEIVDAIFNADRSVEITCRDTTYAWLDEPIPAMIIKDIYPDLDPRYEGQFLPFVFGEVRTPEQDPTPTIPMNLRGQIALPHMGWNQETGDRYGIAAHPCARVVVYRKVELAVDSTDAEVSVQGATETWELVDSGEYTETIIPVTAFNVPMYHHIIDFFVQQADGTELRADIDGIQYRGVWGDLAAEGVFVTPPDPPPGPALRSPIDSFINMTYFIMVKAGVPTDVFDVDSIAALRTKFDNLGIVCDGAIVKPITCREWLSQFLTSFNIDMWQKRNGKITLGYTDEEDPTRIVYTEKDIILVNSFSERLVQKPINQYQYRFQYNFAEDTWGTWKFINTTDQAVLAIGLESKIEKEILDLYFVRNPVTALAVTTHRSSFAALGSYSQEWEIPLPEVPVSLEPGTLVGITHRMGLETGGYVNREAKVFKLSHDLDKLTTKVNTILRVPQVVTSPTL